MGSPLEREHPFRPASEANAGGVAWSHQYLPRVTVIVVTGEIDRNSSAEFADYLQRTRRPGDHVVAHLCGLSFLDSSGLRALLSCAHACSADGSVMHLAEPSVPLARLLTITGVDQHLPLHPTLDQALTVALTTMQTRPPEHP